MNYPRRNGLQRWSILGLSALITLAVWQNAARAAAPSSVSELRQAISNHISQARFAAASWGVKVVSLDSGATLFEHNPAKLFSPASNSKLYTVGLALDRLGGDYRIKTSLYAKAKPNRRGVLQSDLVLYGRGDPTINSRLHGNDIWKALDPLVFALTNAGVRRVSGDLIADESFFRGSSYGSGWSWDDMQYYYGAEVSALTINDNLFQVAVKPGERPGLPCRLTLVPASGFLVFSNRTVTVAKGQRRTISFFRPIEQNVVYVTGEIALDDPGYNDDLTVHNPAAWFGLLYREALARYGVKISGRVRTRSWLDGEQAANACAGMVELGYVESLPLRDIAREVQKPSQNLYTDLLLAHVGEARGRGDARARTTSEDLGILELNRFLQEAGIPKGEVLFEEGSGLSRNNLTTPNATVALLRHMQQRPEAEAYLNALPVAGVDGTLRRRMKDTPAAANVRAKTGTLRWANSLSGHVTTAAGERLLFSIMLNRYYNQGSPTSARDDIDALAVMLAGLSARSAVE